MQHAELTQRYLSLVGRVLKDKWRLDVLLGVGGMAAVFAATHRNGKRGALKMLHREHAMNPAMKARFLREGYVANKVCHPGAVGAFDDDFTEEGDVFFVMELLDGETLKARWRRSERKLPAGDVLFVADRVLDILAAAHAQGIVHRDIKPDNIFLCRDGRVCVLDFGIARLREQSPAADITRMGEMLGTPAFMPPEQARARWELVDARSDIWSLGATMFAVLSGEYVHEGSNAAELVVAAATLRARSIRQLLPDLHPAVAAIIDHAVAFDPQQRWQDARTMQGAVRAAVAQRASLAPGPQPAPMPAGTTPLSYPAGPQSSMMGSSTGSSTTAAVATAAGERPKRSRAGAWSLVLGFAIATGIGLGAFAALRTTLFAPAPAAPPPPGPSLDVPVPPAPDTAPLPSSAPAPSATPTANPVDVAPTAAPSTEPSADPGAVTAQPSTPRPPPAPPPRLNTPPTPKATPNRDPLERFQ